MSVKPAHGDKTKICFISVHGLYIYICHDVDCFVAYLTIVFTNIKSILIRLPNRLNYLNVSFVGIKSHGNHPIVIEVFSFTDI